MTSDIQEAPEQQVFSEKVANALRAKITELVDNTPEVVGIAAAILYAPQLGDDVAPCFVVSTPSPPHLHYWTRLVGRLCKLQQLLITKYYDMLAQLATQTKNTQTTCDGQETSTSPSNKT